MESEYERLRKKVENYPSASAYNRLAELARLNGDDGEAERVCQRCIKEFPRNGQAYVIMAEICQTRGKRDEAIAHLHNAVERDNRSYAGHRMLGEIYNAAGDFTKALHHLRQILVFKPNDEQVSARISELTAKTGGAKPTEPARKPATNTFRGAGDPVSAVAITPGGVPILSAKAAAAPGTRTASLQALCGETGVRGAVVADNQGRVVISHGDLGNQADLLAALAAELTIRAGDAMKAIGHDQLSAWIIEYEKGQVLAFRRDGVLTLAILADLGVRAALLELRARQVLIDLGGG